MTQPSESTSATGGHNVRSALLKARIEIHPAMVAHNQPSAAGTGCWTVGGIHGALVALDLADEAFLAAFGLDSFAAWCAPDLSVSAIPAEAQGKVTAWLAARGWMAPWTLERLRWVAHGLNLDDAALAAKLGVPSVAQWDSGVPSERWEQITRALAVEGWAPEPTPE
jgi:hypothetical protein